MKEIHRQILRRGFFPFLSLLDYFQEKSWSRMKRSSWCETDLFSARQLSCDWVRGAAPKPREKNPRCFGGNGSSHRRAKLAKAFHMSHRLSLDRSRLHG